MPTTTSDQPPMGPREELNMVWPQQQQRKEEDHNMEVQLDA